MEILAVLLFFVYLWGFGFTATSILKKNSENFWERTLMRLGIGMAVLPVLAIILNAIGVPMEWWLFLILALIYPAYYLLKYGKELKFNFKFKKSDIYILVVLLLFAFSLYMYITGAFAYPYLEDDDPWHHAFAAKYISVEKTLYDPPQTYNKFMNHMDPYPPSYIVFFGLLHQVTESLNWTMKFFNALMVSMSIIFFYFFAKRLMRSKRKALFATFILAMVPCYLTHFIWAHALIPLFFFVTIYCLEWATEDKRWKYLGAILVAAILTTQPSQAIKLVLMVFLYLIVKSILARKIEWQTFFATAFGGVLSLAWWGVAAIRYGGWGGIANPAAAATTVKETALGAGGFLAKFLAEFDPAGGSGSRAYTFNDFFYAKSQNLINNPVGVGVFISVLVLISLIVVLWKWKEWKLEKNYWIPITVVWLIFTFLGTNSMTFNLPVGLVPFRFWMLMAIPIALISAEGMWSLINGAKKFGVPAAIILIIVISGVWFTSGTQKYDVNTAQWGPGGQLEGSMEEYFGYSYLKNLPSDTKVFTYHYGLTGKIALGYDMYECIWCSEIVEFKEKELIYTSGDKLHSFLKRNSYEYMIISATSFIDYTRKLSEEEGGKLLDQRMKEITSSGLFELEFQNKEFWLFKIK